MEAGQSTSEPWLQALRVARARADAEQAYTCLEHLIFVYSASGQPQYATRYLQVRVLCSSDDCSTC
jgi:hypothetical protein